MLKKFSSWFLVVLVFLTTKLVGSIEDTFPRTPVITTRKGKVQGRTITLVGGEYDLDPVDVYLGIPYALPPTGIWRFSPTQNLPPWPGVLQATSQGPACPQAFPRMDNQTEALKHYTSGYLSFMQNVRSSTLSMSEDCLYLNIFSPNIRDNLTENTRKKGLGVMVYLTGDSYSWGSASVYDARVLATLGKIIVVTFNYRIGILGYLNPNPNPEDRGSVSNFGLVDQMAALQWVSENIREFGGDPERVTLLGQGYGAASVEFLVHSPMIRQSHFQRVVLMSGSMFAPWARVNQPSEVAIHIARQLGCSIPADLSTHHTNIYNCLRSKSLDELINVDLGAQFSFLTNMGPSIDGVTIKKNFVDIRGKRSFESRTYDSMIGLTEQDWIHELGEEYLVQGLHLHQSEEILRTLVLNNYESHHSEIFLAVQNEYYDFDKTAESVLRMRNLTIAAASDALYSSPAVHSAGTFYRRKNNTYFYNWAHATKKGMYPEYIGGAHGQELDYLFGIPVCNVWPLQTYKYTRSEAILSAMMITYFTNFVKTGNPNSPSGVEELIRTHNDAKRNKIVTWEPFTETNKNYLQLDVKPEMRKDFKAHEMSLWLRLVPQLEQIGASRITGQGHLTGPTWGLARNLTNAPGFRQMPLEGAACTGASEASHYSELLTIGIVFGSILVVANSLVIFCLCYNKQNSRSRWDRDRGQAGSTECLNNSLVENQCVPSFSTPGRTATLHRQTVNPTDRQPALPLASYEDATTGVQQYKTGSTAAADGSVVVSGGVQPYKTGSTDSVGKYTMCSSVPLIADIPAPRQFVDTEHAQNSFRQDVITC